ncbi:MAG: response regulator transcription factor [Bacteroidota bacterium]
MIKDNSYSVVIVDDHLLFAQALENLVNTFKDFHVLYHAKNGKELFEQLNKNDQLPDVVLLDINMPIMNGIETMQELSKNHPEIVVLALSMDDEESTIIKMLRSGAKGYLLKDIHPKTFKDALTEAVQKGFYYSDQITTTVLGSLHRANKTPEVTLKDREIEFLKLACTEKTYKEIAGDMFLSPKTIDGYRETLFEKLHIKSRVGLVLYAIKHNYFKV